jgi:hypothetical protein
MAVLACGSKVLIHFGAWFFARSAKTEHNQQMSCSRRTERKLQLNAQRN